MERQEQQQREGKSQSFSSATALTRSDWPITRRKFKRTCCFLSENMVEIRKGFLEVDGVLERKVPHEVVVEDSTKQSTRTRKL